MAHERKKIAGLDQIPIIIIGAILTGIVAVAFSVSAARKEHVLSQIDQQINDLYSPLDGYMEADSTFWKEFCVANCVGDHAFFDKDPAEEGDIRIWRNYIRATALPNMEKMTSLMSEKRALVVGEGYPEQFRALARHRGGYAGLVASWTPPNEPICPKGHGGCEALYQSENVAQTQWPRHLRRCVQEDLAMLKRRRSEISGAMFMMATPKMTRSPSCDRRD